MSHDAHICEKMCTFVDDNIPILGWWIVTN